MSNATTDATQNNGANNMSNFKFGDKVLVRFYSGKTREAKVIGVDSRGDLDVRWLDRSTIGYVGAKDATKIGRA